MTVDGGKSRGADKGGSVARLDVSKCVWVSVLLGNAEIDKVNDVGLVSDANQYILGF